MALAEVAEVLGGEHVLRQPLHNRLESPTSPPTGVTIRPHQP
jgi:hypothetical protein